MKKRFLVALACGSCPPQHPFRSRPGCIVKQVLAALFTLAALASAPLEVSAQNGSIIQLGPYDYIVNMDARVHRPGDGYPSDLLLAIEPGTWLLSPTNPSIDPQATYTAWSWWSSGRYWTSAILVTDILSGYSWTKGNGTPTYTNQTDAYYIDPLNVAINITTCDAMLLAFCTGELAVSDNLGGASLHVTRISTSCSPVPVQGASIGQLKAKYAK
jgi:hypothetical protein